MSIISHSGGDRKPLLIFDGDCSFCRRWIERWRGITGELVEYEPYQRAATRFPHVPVENFKRAAQLVETDGSVTPAPRAVFRTLAIAGDRTWPLWAYDHLPGFAPVSKVAYRFIADHRNLFDKLDMWLIGRHTTPSTHVVSRWLFLRALAIVYLIAFVSFFVQMDGLIGSKGILPIAPALKSAGHPSVELFFRVPTLAWFAASDPALHGMCWIGIASAILLLIGIAPVLCLGALWILYLSLVYAGQEFLSFQWDTLLLEAGFLAIFIAPWQLLPHPSRETRPPRIPLWLLRWLVFRIMFLSGLVKLTFGDPTWRNWTALDFHYWTQPLPTFTAWWIDQSPHWVKVASLLFMYWAELIAPFFIFGTRRLRLVAFWSIVLLQLSIMATGNYGFFNVLTIALCLLIPDDIFWPRWMRNLTKLPEKRVSIRRFGAWPIWVTAPLAILILVITSMQIVEAWRADRVRWPRPLAALEGFVAPFRSINSYGLFRVMTTERREIVIEGSDDGMNWKPYEFKWKPGDVTRTPRFCAPHMPRLDWQMWFAALSSYEYQPWFVNFLIRLQEGSPDVLALLDTNPFADHPPRQIRALVYEYRFTNVAQRRASGAWWTRRLLGLYCPVLSRSDLQWERDARERFRLGL
jgi:predicted DCC family thiol-disulfide oxidoreductase YuxK